MASNFSIRNLAILTVALVSAQSSVDAHHAFAAEFNARSPVVLSGTIERLHG